MSEFDVLGAAAAGMDAQRAALDVAARNVAAAQVSDPRHPFARLVPQFATPLAAEDTSVDDGDLATGADDDAGPDADLPDAADAAEAPPIRFLGAVPQRGVDADAVTEMVAVLNAQRAYEADASVFDSGKRLAERTIEVGRL